MNKVTYNRVVKLNLFQLIVFGSLMSMSIVDGFAFGRVTYKHERPSFKVSVLKENSNIGVVTFYPCAEYKISPDGRYVATHSARGGARSTPIWELWDMFERRKVGEFRDHDDKLYFSPKNRFVAFLNKGNVRVWGILAGCWVDSFCLDNMGCIKFGAKDQLLYVCRNQMVMVRDVVTKEFICEFDCMADVDSIEISRDGKYFITEDDKSFKAWDMSGNCVCDLGYSVCGVKFDSNGMLLLAPQKNLFKLWNINSSECHKIIDLGVVYGEGPRIDGRFIIYKCEHGYDSYDIEAGVIIRLGNCNEMKISPSGKFCIIRGCEWTEDCVFTEKKVCLWDLQVKAPIHMFEYGHWPIKSIKFSDDETQFTIFGSGAIKIYTDLIAQDRIKDKMFALAQALHPTLGVFSPANVLIQNDLQLIYDMLRVKPWMTVFGVGE